MTTRSGHCLCGAVIFTIDDKKSEVGACHCRMCQRWAGSALVTIVASDDDIRFEGEESIAIYSSSAWGERGFCRTCGSGLFYKVLAPGLHHGMHYVPVGLLDNVEGLALSGEIFYDKRLGVFDYAGETIKQTEAEFMASITPAPEP